MTFLVYFASHAIFEEDLIYWCLFVFNFTCCKYSFVSVLVQFCQFPRFLVNVMSDIIVHLEIIRPLYTVGIQTIMNIYVILLLLGHNLRLKRHILQIFVQAFSKTQLFKKSIFNINLSHNL